MLWATIRGIDRPVRSPHDPPAGPHRRSKPVSTRFTRPPTSRPRPLVSVLPPGLQPACSAAEPLAHRFAAAGHRLWLVGGAVRDAVAGRTRPTTDLDCTTDARPGRVKELVAPSASSVWSQGERYGTIGCVIGERTFEITTYRTERYPAHSRKPSVAFGDDIETDLARRDFTVNAMACDILTGALADPHGGRGDMTAGVLRTPLAPEVSFNDDPLRMLRAARFIAGHGLAPVPELTAAVRDLADRLAIVSAERVRDELERLLLLEDPGPGLQFLAATAVLDSVLPGLVGADVERIGSTLAAVAAVPAARWAALLADQPDLVAARLRELRGSGALIERTEEYLAALAGLSAPPQGAPALRRAALSPMADPDAIEFVRALRQARDEPVAAIDAFASDLAELRATEDIDNPKPPLTGTDVMELLGLEPGPEVGRALDHLRELQFDRGPLSPDQARTELLRRQAGRS